MAKRPPPPHDIDALMRLMQWGRKFGYKIGPTVQVGETIVQITDIRQARGEAHQVDDEGEPDILTQHGAGEDPVDGTSG